MPDFYDVHDDKFPFVMHQKSGILFFPLFSSLQPIFPVNLVEHTYQRWKFIPPCGQRNFHSNLKHLLLWKDRFLSIQFLWWNLFVPIGVIKGGENVEKQIATQPKAMVRSILGEIICYFFNVLLNLSVH